MINKKQGSWLAKPLFSSIQILSPEVLVFIVILLFTIMSRFYNLGVRTMSHDESLHVYFSWLFAQGQGFQHNPLMHGPLQFHLIAFIYFLFGDSDFTARLPHAIASILTVALIWKWRRYLGRTGVLVAAGLTLISPFMLYYGRYARNESLVALFGLISLYSILRYFETGKQRYLFFLTIATALNFTAKETAFIYTAQGLLFFAIYLINRVLQLKWKNKGYYLGFCLSLVFGIISAFFSLGIYIAGHIQGGTNGSQTSAPGVPGQIVEVSSNLARSLPSGVQILTITVVGLLLALVFLLAGVGWGRLRKERLVDMFILLGTFVLPQLAAFPVSAMGWDPLTYQFTWPGWDLAALWAQGPFRTFIVWLVLVVFATVIGLLWDPKRWVIHSLVFWGIYTFFYTSALTNWSGMATGMVGSLGYWLVQQGVHRGSQPWYYYILIQLPLYEFLPLFGSLVAIYFGFKKKPGLKNQKQGEKEIQGISHVDTNNEGVFYGSDLTFPLLIWWAFSSLLAYTMAGEKMPWLTVHIALPLILLTGWGIGKVIEGVDWKGFRKKKGVFSAILVVIFFLSLSACLISILGNNPPFQGKTLDELYATNTFILQGILLLGSGFGSFYLMSGWKAGESLRIIILVFTGILVILTTKDSLRAAYINYDNSKEYLVYAHGASGVKEIMSQLEDISTQTTGGNNLEIAFDSNLPKQGISWPFKWYLRDYPKAFSFDTPDETLLNVPVILVDQNNFINIQPYVNNDYIQFDYTRMVWPNQDYFGLTLQRIKEASVNPLIREALFQIWLNRDYAVYAQATGEGGLQLFNWEPSDKMQLLIRKDIVEKFWKYSVVTENSSESGSPNNSGE